MALGSSNTFVLTGAGNSIATSRIHLNGSLQSLVQSFYSTSVPAPQNYVDTSGANTSMDGDAAQGILYRSSTFNALYINDKANKKNGEGPGANWNRVGIGTRYENDLANTTPANYQIGELFVTVGTIVGDSNARLYMKSSNTATAIKDVGIPHPLSVENTMYAERSISNTKIQAATITSHEIEDRKISNVDIEAVSITEHELADDSVILSKIGFDLAQAVPSGSLLAYGAASAPTGYLLCDGTAVNRTTYAALFTVLGSTYGSGNGNNTFNVPSFGDRLALGKGTNNSTLGTQTGSMSASSQLTSTSFTPSSHSLTTTTVAASAKDSSTTSVVSAVSDHSSLTATTTIPTVVVQWIVKT